MPGLFITLAFWDKDVTENVIYQKSGKVVWLQDSCVAQRVLQEILVGDFVVLPGIYQRYAKRWRYADGACLYGAFFIK